MSEEEIIKDIKEFNSITVMYGQIVFLKSQLVRYQNAISGLLDLYQNAKKEKETSHFLQSKLDQANAKILKSLEDSISKDKIKELKNFYIKDCKNKNITIVPLENLIKNINILLEE